MSPLRRILKARLASRSMDRIAPPRWSDTTCFPHAGAAGTAPDAPLPVPRTSAVTERMRAIECSQRRPRSSKYDQDLPSIERQRAGRNALTLANGAAEVLLVANTPGLSETGGGHGAKGVDFQRWWAVYRMLELEQSLAPDFLLLFEAVQDVTELDSATAPSKASVYQVKKKDTGSWTWGVLTGMTAPKPVRPPKAPKKSKAGAPVAPASIPAPLPMPSFAKVGESVLGKLHLSLEAFKTLPAQGFFVSNAGCEVPLSNGASAATSLPCRLADLEPQHAQLLTNALQSLGAAGAPVPDLARVQLKRVAVHPDDPAAPAIAKALTLLAERSPPHAGQARAFVESLVMAISPLGRHTNTCATFEDLVRQRGFSRRDFQAALGSLVTIPDLAALFESWLKQLQQEGFDFRVLTALRLAGARVAAEKLIGTSAESQAIDDFVDNWLLGAKPGPNVTPYLKSALAMLKPRFSGCRDEELMARFLMRAIQA